MVLPSKLTQCADKISRNARVISTYLQTEEVDVNASEIIAAKAKLAESAFELLHLSRDTGSFLVHLTVDYQVACAFRWLCHFNIPCLIPLDGTISHRELAEIAHAPEGNLKSALRLVMTSKMFEEPEIGLVAHSSVSRQMATDESIQHWIQYISNTIMPTASKHLEATNRWPNSRKVNETAHNIAFNHSFAYFDHVSQHKDLAIEFARTMQAVSDTDSFNSCHLVRSFDWSIIGEGFIVDMGGSTGHASIALAETFPKLRCMVQDLPNVIADSITEFAQLQCPLSITSRIEFQEHSFFDLQRLKGASIYLLRHILHDWPDEKAIQIIRNVVPALGPNSKIIVSDIVLPDRAALPAIEERVMRMNDLLLHQFTNTSERTLQDWTNLFAVANEKLRIQRVYRSPGSTLSLIELSLMS